MITPRHAIASIVLCMLNALALCAGGAWAQGDPPADPGAEPQVAPPTQPEAPVDAGTSQQSSPDGEAARDDPQAPEDGDGETPQAEPNPPPLPLSANLANLIAEAHGREEWLQKDAVRAGITVTFNGETMLEGVMLLETKPPHRVRIDLNDGRALVFDGTRSWVLPAGAESPLAEFHLHTWPYFLSMPFRLDQPNTKVTAGPLKELDGKEYRSATLTVRDDAATDAAKRERTYVLYIDVTTNVLKAMSYVASEDGAESLPRKPQIIVYESFALYGYIVLPKRWLFHQWSEAEGVRGEAIGDVVLGSVDFVTPEPDAFAPPADVSRDSRSADDGAETENHGEQDDTAPLDFDSSSPDGGGAEPDGESDTR